MQTIHSKNLVEHYYTGMQCSCICTSTHYVQWRKQQWVNTMEPPLAPPSFWRRKDEEEGEEEERKEEISPPFKNFWIRHWITVRIRYLYQLYS